MNRRVDKFNFIILLIILCLNLFSCGYSEDDAKKHLPGNYYYEIPSGELQLLIVNQDFTFKQIIYSRNKKDVLYINKGKMHVDDKDIKFENWLECYELSDQKMLLKPFITSFTGIYWEKSKKNEKVLIVVFDQNNYIFRK